MRAKFRLPAARPKLLSVRRAAGLISVSVSVSGALFALAGAAAAQEQSPEDYFGSPPDPVESVPVQPTGDTEAFGEARAESVPTGGRESGRACSGSRSSRRGRRCVYYRNYRIYKRCTFRTNRRRKCRRVSNVTAAALTSLPVDQAALREGKDAKVPSPRARAGKAPKAGVASTLNSNGATNPTLSAVGRLYMTRRDGYPSTCSGTLIRNGVVLTAAHCVYNGPSVPGEDGYQRVDYFAPGQVWDGGSGADTSRYSYVTVNNWWAPTAWMQGDDGQDWALVLLDPYSNGLYPGEYTGTHDAWVNIQWNSGAHVYQAGYPAGGYFRTNFNGNAQWYCDSTWYRGTVGGYDAHRLPNSSNATLQHTCTMNGGASGGPTFVQLSDDSWVIAGVNNRGCCADQQLSNTVFDYLLVHYFDERVRTFYDSIFN